MMRPGGHYERNVRMPYSEDGIPGMARSYEGAGLPGCIASVDGVHVIWHGCPAGSLYFHIFVRKTNRGDEEQNVTNL